MKKLIRRILVWTSIVTVVVVTVLVFLGLQEYKRVTTERPIEPFIQEIQDQEDFVKLDEVSDMFTNAIVAVEDSRFWTRSSVLDFRSIARAISVNIINLSVEEGGSTILQQVAKNMYFDDSVSVVRKIAEYFVARHLNTLYSREEILEIYINKIYYGAGAYGIHEASLIYFETTPLALNDGQAVMLAGLVQSPSVLNPFMNYDLAKERQQTVINRLISNGYISEETGDLIYQMEVFND